MRETYTKVDTTNKNKLVPTNIDTVSLYQLRNTIYLMVFFCRRIKMLEKFLEYSSIQAKMSCNFNLVGMYLRDAVNLLNQYGYILRELYADGYKMPDEYEPNYSYRGWRINVATQNGKVSQVLYYG